MVDLLLSNMAFSLGTLGEGNRVLLFYLVTYRIWYCAVNSNGGETLKYIAKI